MWALEEIKYVERGLVLQEAPSGEDARRRDQRFLRLRGFVCLVRLLGGLII